MKDKVKMRKEERKDLIKRVRVTDITDREKEENARTKSTACVCVERLGEEEKSYEKINRN